MLSPSQVQDAKQWEIIDKLFIAITQLKTLNSTTDNDNQSFITVNKKLAIIKIINTLMLLPYRDGLDCLDKISLDDTSLMQWINTRLIPIIKELSKECKDYTRDTTSPKTLDDEKADVTHISDLKAHLVNQLSVPLSDSVKKNVQTAAESKYDFNKMANQLLPLFNQIIRVIYDKKAQDIANRLSGVEREEARLRELLQPKKEKEKKATPSSANQGILSNLTTLAKTLNNSTLKNISDLMEVIKKKIPNPFSTTKFASVKKLTKLTPTFAPSVKLKERIDTIKNEISTHINQINGLLDLLNTDDIKSKKNYDPKWITELSNFKTKLQQELETLNFSLEGKEEVKNIISDRIQTGAQNLKERELKLTAELDQLLQLKKDLLTEQHRIQTHPISEIVLPHLTASDLSVLYSVMTALGQTRFHSDLKEHQSNLALSGSGEDHDSQDTAIVRLTAIVNFGSFMIYHTDPIISEQFPFMQRYSEGLASIEKLRTNPVVLQIVMDYLQENIIAALRHFCMHSVDSSIRCDDILSEVKRPALKQTTEYLNQVITTYFENKEVTALPPALATEAVDWNRLPNKPGSAAELLKIAGDIIIKFQSDARDFIVLDAKTSFFPHSSSELLDHFADLILQNKLQNNARGKMMQKYDGLIQALGEVFNALASGEDKAKFANLLDMASPLMHYRNHKTHSGITEKNVLITCLKTILSNDLINLVNNLALQISPAVTASVALKGPKAS